jgi:glucose-1-phosphate cytidylyltransferase
VGQILKATGSDLRPHILGKARNEIDRQSLDASKARRILGWEPKTSLEDGLAASIDWYRKLLHAGPFHSVKPAVERPVARSLKPVSQVKAVILCGGRGTRANPYTRRVPKALIPVAGLPLIEHVLRIYASHGVKEFVLATGYLGEEIVRYFKRGPWNVTCLDTGDTTDTAGRLRSVLDHVDETFHVAYVDGLGTMDLTALLQVHRERGLAATMLSAPLRSQYGVIESDSEDRVVRFEEKPMLSGHWINAGYFVFEKSALEHVKGDSLEIDVLPELSRRNQLQTYRHTGFWRSLDTLKDQRELDELWRPYSASLESSVPTASQLPQWLSKRYAMATKQSQ